MAEATYYSVVRYVPDPLREEQINVGVVAMTADGSTVAVRFERSLDRARSLGRSANLGFLRELRTNLEALAARQSDRQLALAAPDRRGRLMITMEGKPRLDLGLLRDVSGSWANSVQFSEPRGSLEVDPDRLAEDIYRRLVAPSAEPRVRARDRRWIVAQAVSSLETHIAVSHGLARESVIRRNRAIEGVVEQHTFELVLEREDVRHAAHAISFEVDDQADLSREVDAAAWLLEDTRRARPNLPLALLAVGGSDSPAFGRARHICDQLTAHLVPVAQFDSWASAAIRELTL